MQINWTQKQSLNVKRDNRSSRFLVDLNSNINHDEPKKDNVFKRGYKHTKEKAFFIKESPVLFIGRESFLRKILKRLAIFSLFVFIYKFFYRIGWSVIFIGRFLYFLMLIIFRVKKLDTLLKEKRNRVLQADNSEQLEVDKIIKQEKKLEQIKEDVIPKIKKQRKKIFLKINWKALFIIFYPAKLLFSILKGSYKFGVNLFDYKINFSLKTIFPKINYSFAKSAMGFAVVLLIFTIPFKAFDYLSGLNDVKGRVLGESVSAFEELAGAFKGASHMDFTTADTNFLKASYSFLEAKNEVDNINKFLLSVSKLLPNEKVRLASMVPRVLEIGETSALLGRSLNEAISIFGGSEKNTKIIIDHLYLHIEEARGYALKIDEQISDIDPKLIPDQYRDQFILIQQKSSLAYLNLTELNMLLEKAKTFLGFGYKKRYLLVFQNNTELRASGGFVGSYALMDFFNGEIKNLEVPEGGSYDTEAGLYVNVASPEPLRLLDPVWNFWNANWWPDWGKSAEKLEWFLEKSNGPTVDGVISLTPTVMEKLLEVIGPIYLEDYNTTFTSDNFWEKTQSLVEQKPDDHPLAIKNDTLLASSSIEISTTTQAELQEKPKKVISDLMNVVISTIKNDFSYEMLLSLLSLVDESFREKHILLNFHDQDLQKFVEEYKWGGRVVDAPDDYLMVVNTNLGGGKSDKMIKESISHTSSVQENGDVINTLRIIKRHTATKGDNFTGVRNVNWMRIYVPTGSELIEADGFETPHQDNFRNRDINSIKDVALIDEEELAFLHEESDTKIYNENKKTVFANWFIIDPGEEKEIYIKYKLPFKIEKKINPEQLGLIREIDNLIHYEESDIYNSYSFYIQKQAGSVNTDYSTKLILPEKFELYQTNTKNSNLLEAGNLDEDKFYYVIFN